MCQHGVMVINMSKPLDVLAALQKSVDSVYSLCHGALFLFRRILKITTLLFINTAMVQ